ncbi:MAG TPA: hypothetical protein VFY54_03800 [Rubrobacter sp.]|nr:hypothetical protein [Rubrobacter sp.]
MRPSSGSARIFELGCWHDSVRIDLPGSRETGEQGHLDRASGLLLELSEKERAAMQHLSKLGSGTHPAPGGRIH